MYWRISCLLLFHALRQKPNAHWLNAHAAPLWVKRLVFFVLLPVSTQMLQNNLEWDVPRRLNLCRGEGLTHAATPPAPTPKRRLLDFTTALICISSKSKPKTSSHGIASRISGTFVHYIITCILYKSLVYLHVEVVAVDQGNGHGAGGLQGVDYKGGHTPDFEFLAVLDLDRGVIVVFREEGRVASETGWSGKAFDGEFPIQDGDDDLPVCWLEAAVDHQDIVVMNAGTGHGVAADAQEEGGLWMVNAVLVEI
jgi:hypothetical protein